MNMRNFVKVAVAAMILAGFFTGAVQADKQQVQEKLSKDISIRLSDVTISNALDSIGQKAGLKIVLSDEAIWKLPYGEATRLSVSLSGPLADSLTEMLNAFFMRYAVGEQEITIYPRSELEHILGRPSAKQLELLKAIYTRTIRVYYLGQVQKTINEAIDEQVLISPIEVQAQLNDFLRQLVGKKQEWVGTKTIMYQGRPVEIVEKERETEPNEPEPIEYNLPTPVTLIQLLNQVIVQGQRGSSNTRWYISGMDFPGQTPEVHVVDQDEFRTLRLKQKIDVSYTDQTLDKIFQDLASRAGVSLVVMTGSQLHEHTLSASMQNIEIHQAIRNIAEMAGVGCEIRESIVLALRNPPSTKSRVESKDTGKITTEGYVGKISIPMDGGKYYLEFMLRESDLTEKLKKLRAEKMKQVLGESMDPPAQPE
jgi:hypothetical protein